MHVADREGGIGEPFCLAQDLHARFLVRVQTSRLADDPLQIAMPGGYLARSRDPPPGSMVVWRGLTRLHDITVGAAPRHG